MYLVFFSQNHIISSRIRFLRSASIVSVFFRVLFDQFQWTTENRSDCPSGALQSDSADSSLSCRGN